MTINNALNTSQTDFQVTAGTYEFANRVRGKVGVENLGITYSGGTFSVTGYDGTALSSTNPGYVTLQSKSNLGQLKTISVTADQSFIDDAGASEIIGNLFGLTSGVAYTEDIPFFIYAVLNDTEDAIAFMISRVPNALEAPAAAFIGDPGDPVADHQASFWSFDTVTEADFEANPCICIGSFRMQMSASDDWTVQTLCETDGIGKFNDRTIIRFMPGSFGAASGSFILPNGGTAPVFSTTDAFYFIRKNGICDVYFNSLNDGGTDGAGAVITLLAIPYIGDDQITSSYIGECQVVTSSAEVPCFCQIQSAQNIALRYSNTWTTAIFLRNSAFLNGNRSIRGKVSYQVQHVPS